MHTFGPFVGTDLRPGLGSGSERHQDPTAFRSGEEPDRGHHDPPAVQPNLPHVPQRPLSSRRPGTRTCAASLPNSAFLCLLCVHSLQSSGESSDPRRVNVEPTHCLHDVERQIAVSMLDVEMKIKQTLREGCGVGTTFVVFKRQA